MTLSRSISFLNSDGEMARRTREFDWTGTPVGPIDDWPATLKTAVQIMLGSRYAMWLGWGPDFTFFYNDAYAAMTLGPKHPGALGKPAREVWPEIWDDVGPRAEKVMRTGEATWDEDLLLFLERRGFPEETYHTFSYSPLHGDGASVGGMLCVVTEDTERTIGARRLKTLRELAAGTTDKLRTTADACQTAAEILNRNLHDLPLSLIYLLDRDQRHAHLYGRAGVPTDATIAPPSIDLAHNPTPWPLTDVIDRGMAVHVTPLPDRMSELKVGIWPESPSGAVVLPLARPGQNQLDGFLVVGISPRLPLEDRYRGFFDLLAGQLVTVIANAKAYEEERQRAEALAELDRAKTTFFSNVSHEFRTPLTLMLGPVADMLSRRDADEVPPQLKQELEIVNRNGVRLLRLVNSLLDFARIEAGRAEARFRPVDLAKLTSDLASVFRSAMENAGLNYRVDCPSISQNVYVDGELWEKIVLNLLSNAYKFTMNGEVSVSLTESNQAVQLRVSDTGSGIPADQLGKVFDRFHRIEGTVGRTHEGSGIGLALVNGLVELHGGTIEVNSEPGVGSVFTVHLPLGKSHLPRDQVADTPADFHETKLAISMVDEALHWFPNQDAVAHPQGINTEHRNEAPSTTAAVKQPKPVVLVADDNADMRTYVGRLLADHYHIVPVADGQQALDRIRTDPPDLILSDVMMPRLDGLGLLKEVREDRGSRDIPFILLSARAGEESCVEGLEAGADDYLVKPFTARDLLARVHAHLTIAQLRTEKARLVQENEARLQMALAAARMFVWEWNLETDEVILSENFIDVLPNMRRTKFDSVAEAFEFVHPEDVDRVRATIDRAIENRADFQITFRFLDEAGEIAWLEDRGQVIVNEVGKPVRLLGVVVDVTDQQHSRAVLQQRERFLQEIFDTTPECIKLVAADGTLLQMNEAGLQMIESNSESEVVGRSVYGIIAPEHQDAFRQFNQDICRGQRGVLEFDIIGLQGKRLQMETHAVPLPMADGRMVQLALTRDITERKRTEAAIREREAAFRDMADNAPAMLWVTDPEASCTFISRGWYEFTGQVPDQGLGFGWLDAIHPEDRVSAGEIFQRANEERQPFSLDYRVRSADGKYRWAVDTGRPHFDPDGNFRGYIGSVTDIHERKTSQDFRAGQARVLEMISNHRPLHDVLTEVVYFLEQQIEGGIGSILLLDDDGERLRLGAAPRLPARYNESVDGIRIGEGQGSCGTAAHRRKSVFVKDIQSDPLWTDFRDLAAEHGLDGACWSEPIFLGDESLLGTLAIYFSSPRIADDREVASLQQLARFAAIVIERYRAHQSIHESEERFRAFTDATSDIVYLMNADWTEMRLLKGDDFATDSVEHPAAWLDRFIHQEDRQTFLGAVRTAIEQQDVLALEHRVVRGDGTTGWAHSRAVPILDQQGRLLEWFGTASDVTARRENEEIQRRNAKTFAALIEQSPLGIYVVDSDFRVAQISRGAMPAFQNVQPVVGRDFGEVMHALWPPGFADQAIGIFRHNLETGEPYVSPGLTETRKDLEITESYEWQVHRVTLADGRFGAVCYFYDTTALQQALVALRDSEQRFRTLAENISQLAWTCDTFGEVNWYNQRWYDYTGHSFEEMRDWGWKKVVHPDHLERVVRSVESAREREEVWEDTFPIRGAHGEDRWFLSRAIPIRDEQGNVLRWFGTNTDVTDLREAQQLLRDADQRKDEFLAMLAHELRNPLAPIRSGLDLLAIELKNQENDVIELMQEQVDHIVRLVDDLLDVSRIMRGKVELRKEPVELAKLVKQSVDAVQTAIESHQHKLSVTLPNRPVWLEVDGVRIVQVIENLLGNAAKYMEANGKIELSAEAHDDQVTISVRDEGIGIEAELLPKVFELFTQSSRALDRSQGGLGIGLTLVKQLVELHGGTAMVESAGLGHGSQFTITLPIGDVAAQQLTTPDIDQNLGQPRRIVLVDDNRSAVLLLDRLLMKFGDHEIHQASDGPSALNLIRKVHPEIVLLDIGLPEMDGFEVADALRQDREYDDMLLVALTGYGHAEVRQRCEQVGFDEHLVKPPSVDQIKCILGHPKLR